MAAHQSPGSSWNDSSFSTGKLQVGERSEFSSLSLSKFRWIPPTFLGFPLIIQFLCAPQEVPSRILLQHFYNIKKFLYTSITSIKGEKAIKFLGNFIESSSYYSNNF